MLFTTARRLIRRYGEHRIYTSEITFSRQHEPKDIYLFLSDAHVEIKITVMSIVHVIHRRRRGETLYQLQLTPTKDILLLVIDHRRSNHFVYCTSKTYEQWLPLHEAAYTLEIEQPTAPSSTPYNNLLSLGSPYQHHTEEAVAIIAESIPSVPVSESSLPPRSHKHKKKK